VTHQQPGQSPKLTIWLRATPGATRPDGTAATQTRSDDGREVKPHGQTDLKRPQTPVGTYGSVTQVSNFAGWRAAHEPPLWAAGWDVTVHTVRVQMQVICAPKSKVEVG